MENSKTTKTPSLLEKFGKSFVSGFISSGIAKYAGHPLDTIKTRIQVTGDKVKLRHHFTKIYASEGIGGFFKGAISPVVGTAPIMATLFATNDLSKRLLSKTNLPKIIKEFLPGSIAGFSTLIILVPSDLLKIRKQGLKHKTITYKELIKGIVKTNGVFGLYKGFTASFIRVVPQYGIVFYSYDKIQKLFKNEGKKISSLWFYSQKIIAGGLAGQICCIVGYPVDVVRSYIQYHPDHNSVIKTTKYLYNTHGIGYFSRGLLAANIRSIIVSGLGFGFYEIINTNLLKF